MQDYFYSFAERLESLLTSREVFTTFLEAEDSDFVRFNKNRVRQAGRVSQAALSFDLIEGRRHASGRCQLTGVLSEDTERLSALVESLREQRGHLDEDPHLFYATEVKNSEHVKRETLPEPDTLVTDIMDAADQLDLVGFCATGTVHRGFANSFGQRNWYSAASFNFDWSCYLEDDKAVKSGYAGSNWVSAELRRRMEQTRTQLDVMKRKARTLRPGGYRVFVAPAALQEILGAVAWGGFGLKTHRTRQTPLLKMTQEDRRVHPKVTVVENQAEGLTPAFTAQGFIVPKRVTLIDQGVYRGYLVSPRSCMEYGEPVNAATEVPTSLDMSAGDLAQEDILDELNTGLYVNNFWYCNFSDRNDCRITGMTRYACFWVEEGKIKAPVNVMRFDDSVYRMLGENLLALTRQREFLLDPSTYQQRSTNTIRLPGALIEDFKLTL